MTRTRRAVLGVCMAAGLLLAAACSDDDEPGSSATATTEDPDGNAAPVETTTSSTTVSPPVPPFSDVEELVAEALAGFGLVAQRAENSRPGSASLWVALEDGGELYVSALLAGTNNGNPTVIDETTAEGIVVRTVEYPSGLSRLAFDCRTHEYEVTGDPPPNHDDLTAFTAALGNALSCQ